LAQYMSVEREVMKNVRAPNIQQQPKLTAPTTLANTTATTSRGDDTALGPRHRSTTREDTKGQLDGDESTFQRKRQFCTTVVAM
jgi:hypothetical protein